MSRRETLAYGSGFVLGVVVGFFRPEDAGLDQMAAGVILSSLGIYLGWRFLWGAR